MPSPFYAPLLSRDVSRETYRDRTGGFHVKHRTTIQTISEGVKN